MRLLGAALVIVALVAIGARGHRRPARRRPRATRIGIPVPRGPVMAVEVDRAGRVVRVTGYGYA